MGEDKGKGRQRCEMETRFRSRDTKNNSTPVRPVLLSQYAYLPMHKSIGFVDDGSRFGCAVV
jgi:hypothetical protein